MSNETRFTDIKRRMDADWASYRSEWNLFWNAASIDTRLEAGDATLTTELNYNLTNNFAGQWYFNRCRPMLQSISGFQRRHRKSSVVVPMENGDQNTADQWTKILLQIYKKEGVYHTLSDAFYSGACVSGLNLLQVYLDFTKDPLNGDLKINRIPFSKVFLDPYFQRPDFSDCSFIWIRNYISYADAIGLLPGHEEEILALPSSRSGTSPNNKFTYIPQTYGLTAKGFLSYDEYYYRTYRKQKMLLDKETGDVMEVTIDDPDYINHFLEQNPSVGFIEQTIPTVRLAIAVQERVMFDGPQQTGLDRFPFAPVLGYFNPEIINMSSRIQGVARSLRDVQMLFNRRVILSMDAAESLITTGYIYKEEAIVDVKNLFETGAGRMIPLKRSAQMTDIAPIPPPSIPPEYFQIQESLSREFNMVTGINEEVQGAANDDVAAMLARQRAGAGLIVLQSLTDGFDHTQEIMSEIMMDTIRNNFTPAKIKTLLAGEEPAPLFYNKAFGKYRCMVESGFDTESQRQYQFLQLVNLRQLGIEIPEDVMIKAATLQNKNDLIEAIQQRQQAAAQQAQQQAEVQQQLLQAQSTLAYAQAGAHHGTQAERESRIPENRAFAIERLAQAEKDRDLALLNKVKMLKEIEDLDFGHLERLVNMAKILNEKTQSPLQGASNV